MPFAEPRAVRALLVAVLAATTVACNRAPPPATPAGAGAPPPAAVGVVTVQAKPVPVARELPGRVEAYRVAQVRARAAGIVQKRLFEEGSDVRAGQPLYRIDPAPLQAALANSEAALQRAEASLASARQKEQRYRPLVQTKAVSEQEFADMVATRRVAEAEVAAARAARETARLNLGYASVTAPISGRVGRSLVTEGALVGQGEATPLTTIQQLDPVYVNLTQSGADYLRLRQAIDSGKLQRADEGQAKVTLSLEDGTTYAQPGRLLFTDVTVEQSTGTVTLRAVFPNPQRLLMPGMYVRAQLAQAVDTQAWQVPQQAVVRKGDSASVYVVGADGKAALKPVKIASALGIDWVVTEGLADGDQVIVDGLQKIGPGAPVRPVPWQTPGSPVATASAPPASGPAPAAPAPSAATAASPTTAPASSAAASPRASGPRPAAPAAASAPAASPAAAPAATTRADTAAR